MKLAVTLIVLTATGECSVDNIDISEPVAMRIESMEVCTKQAAIIDQQRGLRAFCVN